MSVMEAVRVLDFSHMIAGPFYTMLLADVGADVIKVEQPGKGDLIRQMDPITPSGQGGAFLSVNRNKRSIAVNLKEPEGIELIRLLVERSDVIVENFRPGVTKPSLVRNAWYGAANRWAEPVGLGTRSVQKLSKER